MAGNRRAGLRRWWTRLYAQNTASTAVTDVNVLSRYTSDPSFPFLVSFPRTGSHWLRMLMELYFERPSLVRVFYFPERDDYLCLHTHDMTLELERENILYLYRNPVDTVYSQIRFEQEDPFDSARVRHWAGLYARHLKKWLVEETFSQTKTVLSYEALQLDLHREFAKVCAHFKTEFDPGKLDRSTLKVSKEEVSSRTLHDRRVINSAADYAGTRDRFTQEFSDLIWEAMLREHDGLGPWFGRDALK